MRAFCATMGVLCLLCQAALGADYRGVGNWADPNGWSGGAPPTGAEEIKVRGDTTVLTLNTSTGTWGAAQRLRVYEGAKMIVAEGGQLLGAGWVRIGANSAGALEQTGGLIRIDNEKLAIGDSAGSDGHYTISGGILTYTNGRGELMVGARGGKGLVTIVGTDPNILMEDLIVGDGAGASGTVEFLLKTAGVSPIRLTGVTKIDALGQDTVCALVIGSAGGAPPADVLLVDLPDGVAVGTLFDTVNGEPAVEGAPVVVRDHVTTYNYTLTYAGGPAGNDIMLRYVSMIPAPKVIYVTDSPDVDADTVLDDQGWIDWLVAEGYTVDARRGYWVEPLDPNRIAELEAADLILFSRGGNTANYDATGEAAKWNGLTTPLLDLNAYMIRNKSKWYWMNSNTGTKDSGSPTLFAVDPNHPIFAGVALDANDLVKVLDPNVGSGNTSFISSLDVGNGTLIASSVSAAPMAWIAEWAPGVEFYTGVGQFAGGWRMIFMAGTQDVSSPQGAFNLNAAGQQILRNMMAYLIAKERPQPVGAGQ
jgi:hypothetical protein